MDLLNTPPAIVILGPSALATARRIQTRYPGAQIYGLATRLTDTDTDVRYPNLGDQLRTLYRSNTPLIVLCAAGIIIRCLAPALSDKGAEPPVLAVAEDGSAVVPLLGGLSGVNVLARDIAAALDTTPAITTSGELRFGTCLLNPPSGYRLASLDQGKQFVSSLLSGQSTRLEGAAPWLEGTGVPLADDAALTIRISASPGQGDPDELRIHPQCVIAAVTAVDPPIVPAVRAALQAQDIAEPALAALLVPSSLLGDTRAIQAAEALQVPVRGSAHTDGLALDLLHTALSAQSWQAVPPSAPNLALAVTATPLPIEQIGHARGSLSVIGLGPGSADLLAPAARQALDAATDILGYATYVQMAGPFRPDQVQHRTDNREELQRARHAFELACTGRRVVMVSSGDPGVFAMAAAVLEALDQAEDPAWAQVDLNIVPGISAAMATAAVAGAPLGHDFCILSLSDNLKPWATIETRLRHAAEADLVMAFYNPISRARPWQLDRALAILRAICQPETPVILGRDIGRPGATLHTTTLGALRADQVDMRTLVIIGSSTTRTITRSDREAPWVYTPRWYPVPPDKPSPR